MAATTLGGRIECFCLKAPAGQASFAVGVIGRLLSMSLPIVMGSILWPVMQMIDTSLVPVRMQAAGYSQDAVREALGHLGMALSLVHFPNVITQALSVTLVPAIAEASALNSYRRIQQRAVLRIAVIFGLPVSPAAHHG